MARKFRKATLPNLAALDSRNTDRYYRSSDVSVIAPTRSHTEAVKRHGEAIARRKKASNPLAHLDERDAERYYRGDDAPPRQLKRTQRRKLTVNHELPQQGSQTVPVEHSQSMHPLKVVDRELVNDVVDQAIQRVRSGEKRVIIETGNGLSMAVTTRLDSLVTRNRATEDERYAINVKLLPKTQPAQQQQRQSSQKRVPETRSTDQMLGQPQPANRPSHSKPLNKSPRDFLLADDEPEESDIPTASTVQTKEVIGCDQEQVVDNDLIPRSDAPGTETPPTDCGSGSGDGSGDCEVGQ